MVFRPRRAGLMSGLGLLFLLPVVAGCGSGRGHVYGRVLYEGTPLPGGRVTFRPADPKENSVSAELDADGNYQAVLSAGEVLVSVDNRELEPRGPRDAGLPSGLPADVKKFLGSNKPGQPRPKSRETAPGKSSGRYVEIPSRYYSAEKSHLGFTVQGGEQRHDIELTK